MFTAEEWRELDLQDAAAFELDQWAWLRSAYRFDKHSRRRLVLRLLNKIGDVPMARGKGAAKQPSTAKGSNWTEFVDIPLPDGAWDDVMRSMGKFDEVQAWLQDIVASGHRVSFSYNSQNDSTICSLTGREGCGANEGKTLTSYADGWYTALQVALYKHYVLAEQDWSKAGTTSQRPRFG